MRRYEDHNYGSLRVLFLTGTGLWLVSGLAIGFWRVFLAFGHALPNDQVPDWVHAGGIGCFVGSALFVFLGWEMYSRPRLVADETGGVWRGKGVVRFRWDDITSWSRVISVDSEGEESVHIELSLTDGRLLLIEGNTVEDFVKAFFDFVPSKQGGTRRCT